MQSVSPHVQTAKTPVEVPNGQTSLQVDDHNHDEMSSRPAQIPVMALLYRGQSQPSQNIW